MEPDVVFQEAFGFIERADVVKEIFFHYSEFKGDLEALQAGDDVEFTIKDRNVGSNLFHFTCSWSFALDCPNLLKLPVSSCGYRVKK